MSPPHSCAPGLHVIFMTAFPGLISQYTTRCHCYPTSSSLFVSLFRCVLVSFGWRFLLFEADTFYSDSRAVVECIENSYYSVTKCVLKQSVVDYVRWRNSCSKTFYRLILFVYFGTIKRSTTKRIHTSFSHLIWYRHSLKWPFWLSYSELQKTYFIMYHFFLKNGTSTHVLSNFLNLLIFRNTFAKPWV